MIQYIVFKMDDDSEVVIDDGCIIHHNDDKTSVNSIEDMNFITDVAKNAYEYGIIGCMCEKCRNEKDFKNNEDIPDDSLVN